MRRLRWMTTLSLLASLGSGIPADAQLGGLIKKKAAEAVKKDATKSPARDTAKTTAQPAAPATSPATAPPAAPGATAGTAPAAPATSAQGSGQPAQKADPKVWENYDFVPGSKILFYTDFSEDRVGNFARGLTYVNGPAEVVERDDVKMLRATGPTTFLIPVGRKLPERFTLEIDVLAPSVTLGGYDYVVVEGGPSLDRGEKSAEVNWHPGGSFIIGGGQSVGERRASDEETARAMGDVTHLRILMDSAYFKMYANEKRLYNIPVLHFKRDGVIRVRVKGGEEPNQATYLTSIRLAESETDVMYDALSTKGRWVTQGILFATGKAELQPESRPVLKEIASTLKKYGDLRILIEGHTDNVGAAAANLTLSDARAAAVKAALVTEYGVAADRLTTRGFGDTKPSVPNTTAAGRAQNRRVEIVKQ